MILKQTLSNSPTVWFATLERALRVGDFVLAAQAQAELRDLGVEVRVSWDTEHSSDSSRRGEFAPMDGGRRSDR